MTAVTGKERIAAQRRRDAAKGIAQVNIRVPAIYDACLKVLAEDLRKGMRLEGFVVRDMTTGRVRTVIL